MPTVLHRKSSGFKILNPETSQWISFKAGRLDIEESDPNWKWVKEEALRNSEIIVVTNLLQCPDCSEGFTGKVARMDLGKHRKATHPFEWDADREAAHVQETAAIVKSREGFPCPVCGAHQSFPDEASLALHVRSLHGAPVEASQGPDSPIPDDVRDELWSDTGDVSQPGATTPATLGADPRAE